MNCNNCNHLNPNDAKFCIKCGQELIETNLGSVDQYFAKRDKACQLCGTLAPTAEVEFNQNIGLLVMRHTRKTKGRLCKKCISKEFWNKSIMTFVFGWWGTISMIATPYYLIGNINNFTKSSSLSSE